MNQHYYCLKKIREKKVDGRREREREEVPEMVDGLRIVWGERGRGRRRGGGMKRRRRSSHVRTVGILVF